MQFYEFINEVGFAVRATAIIAIGLGFSIILLHANPHLLITYKAKLNLYKKQIQTNNNRVALNIVTFVEGGVYVHF